MESKPELDQSQPRSRPDASARAPRVALADDQEEFLITVAGLLEGKFELVGTTCSGERVLQLAISLNPDVLVLDIGMPVIGGIEAALLVRESGLSSKVVFLTVHTDFDFVRAALSAGALGYVAKPFLASDLIPAIRAALAGDTFISPSLYLQ